MSNIVSSTCQAIVDEYYDELVACPTTAVEWKRMSDNWLTETQFPHCLGAIYGTHIPINRPSKEEFNKEPEDTGSAYYNWKHFYSVILLCLVDANYRVIWSQVGSSGRQGDAGLFLESNLRTAFMTGALNVPQKEPLPGEDYPLPYYILGDNAFPLQTWLMHPYSRHAANVPQKAFNYRLSRARIRVSVCLPT